MVQKEGGGFPVLAFAVQGGGGEEAEVDVWPHDCLPGHGASCFWVYLASRAGGANKRGSQPYKATLCSPMAPLSFRQGWTQTTKMQFCSWFMREL